MSIELRGNLADWAEDKDFLRVREHFGDVAEDALDRMDPDSRAALADAADRVSEASDAVLMFLATPFGAATLSAAAAAAGVVIPPMLIASTAAALLGAKAAKDGADAAIDAAVLAGMLTEEQAEEARKNLPESGEDFERITGASKGGERKKDYTPPDTSGLTLRNVVVVPDTTAAGIRRNNDGETYDLLIWEKDADNYPDAVREDGTSYHDTSDEGWSMEAKVGAGLAGVGLLLAVIVGVTYAARADEEGRDE